jgi:hypothetical protein
VAEAEAARLALDRMELARRAGDPPYVALTLADHDPSGLQAVTPIRLANGAALRGWQAREAAGRLRVVTWWEVAGPLAPGDYHVFNHLRAADRPEPIAIQDAPASSPAWRPGDRVLVWVDFEPPAAGPLFVEVGMYTWPDITRVAVLDRAGDPLAPIRLGPLAWP